MNVAAEIERNLVRNGEHGQAKLLAAPVEVIAELFGEPFRLAQVSGRIEGSHCLMLNDTSKIVSSSDNFLPQPV